MEFIKKNMGLIVAFLIAAVAGGIVYVLITVSLPHTPVVIAQQTMSVGKIIDNEDVAIKMMPSSAVQGSTFSSINEVVGKTVLAGPIIQGDMVRGQHLTVMSSLGATLKTLAPVNWTAVELPADIGKGMQDLRRGDKVDVYGEIDVDGGIIVGLVVSQAIVIKVPKADSEESAPQFILAVPPDKVEALADLSVRKKPMTLTMQNIDQEG